VRVDDTQPGVIKIGGYITKCPNTYNPEAFFGWTIYAANKINSESAAIQFAKHTFGEGCTLSGNQGNGAQDTLLYWVVADGYAPDMEYIDEHCPISLAQTIVMYSRKMGTALMWSYGQDPHFLSPTGSYDSEIYNSFHFVYPKP